MVCACGEILILVIPCSHSGQKEKFFYLRLEESESPRHACFNEGRSMSLPCIFYIFVVIECYMIISLSLFAAFVRPELSIAKKAWVDCLFSNVGRCLGNIRSHCFVYHEHIKLISVEKVELDPVTVVSSYYSLNFLRNFMCGKEAAHEAWPRGLRGRRRPTRLLEEILRKVLLRPLLRIKSEESLLKIHKN